MIAGMASLQRTRDTSDLVFGAWTRDENMAVFDIWLLRVMTG